LANKLVGPIRRGDVAREIGNGTDPMHIGWPRIGHLRVALHENADLALLPDGLLCGGDRARPANGDGQDQPRKQHGAAHGKNDQRILRQRDCRRRSSNGYCAV
jgi:hypothetical protein